MAPLMQLAGCSEDGGMYTRGFIFFWKVLEMNLPFSMESVVSKTLTDKEGLISVISHFNIPKLLTSSEKAFQSTVKLSVHIPRMSSMGGASPRRYEMLRSAQQGKLTSGQGR